MLRASYSRLPPSPPRQTRVLSRAVPSSSSHPSFVLDTTRVISVITSLPPSESPRRQTRLSRAIHWLPYPSRPFAQESRKSYYMTASSSSHAHYPYPFYIDISLSCRTVNVAHENSDRTVRHFFRNIS